MGEKWFFETNLSDFLPLGATEPRHTEKKEDSKKYFVLFCFSLTLHYLCDMMNIYTLTSPLHDARAVDEATREFLSSLAVDYTLKGDDFSDYGSTMSIIYVRTGGTEGLFARLLPSLRERSNQPFYLLTSGKSNSLAASMEILSYLRQQGEEGEIIHGKPAYVTHRLEVLRLAHDARVALRGMRFGVIGEPSDWLISSHTDDATILEKTGIEMVHIAMKELTDAIATVSRVGASASQHEKDEEEKAVEPTNGQGLEMEGAETIYRALKELVSRHRLQGFTLRCFDLLKILRNTGCLALACLNKEGIVAGCEGDIPAMLSMTVSRALTGLSGFQANPSRIDVEKGEIIFAHCTIPLNMVDDFELDTHFESGIGVGIRGRMREGDVTVFKMSGDATRFFAEEGVLVRNQNEPDLCRTQQIIRLDNIEDTRYFLTCPIGNHHIIMPGRWKKQIEELLE